jgi:hypothetical protein
MFHLALDCLRFTVAGTIMAFALAAHSLSPERLSAVLASAGF